MKKTVSVHWNDHQNRLVLSLWVLICLLATAVPALAEDEGAESFAAERAEVEGMRSELVGTEKVGGPVICTDTTIRGKFEDLVSYSYERKDGYAGWALQADAEACLTASTLDCLSPWIVVLKLAGDTGTNKNSTVGRWIATAGLAEVLGQDVQILFSNLGGGWPVCQVDRFYVFR